MLGGTWSKDNLCKRLAQQITIISIKTTVNLQMTARICQLSSNKIAEKSSILCGILMVRLFAIVVRYQNYSPVL